MLWVYLTGLLGIVGVLVADIWADVNYRLAANISLIYIAAFVTVFTVLYWGRSRWRSNYLGKAFLIKGILLAAVLWQACAAVWIDTEYPYRHVVRFIIYTGGAASYLAMLIILWREQQRGRREHEVTGPPGPP